MDTTYRPGMSQAEVDTLAEEMVTLRAKGQTWAQIEAESGVPAPQCAVLVQRYLTSNYAGTSVVEARQLQIRRLEMLMGYLWEQVEAGDFLTQGRNTTNLISVIQQVTELLDLRKDRLRDEQIKLTQEQGGLLVALIDAIKLAVMDDVLNMLTDASVYSPETGMRSIPDLTAVRSTMEREWSGWFAIAADKALDEASPDSNDSVASVPSLASEARKTNSTNHNNRTPGNGYTTIKGELS